MVMCEWTLADIKNRASNKAFAKVTTLTLDLETYKEDLRTGNIGGATYEEFEQVVKGYENRASNMELHYRINRKTIII